MSEDLGARLHWGKWFPLVAAAAVERNYPGMPEFKQVCSEFDPQAVFRNRFPPANHVSRLGSRGGRT